MDNGKAVDRPLSRERPAVESAGVGKKITIKRGCL